MATVYVVSVLDDNESLAPGDVENVLSNVGDEDVVVTTTGRVLYAPGFDVEAVA